MQDLNQLPDLLTSRISGMSEETIQTAFLGGVILALTTSAFYLLFGKIMGMSSILGSLLRPSGNS